MKKLGIIAGKLILSLALLLCLALLLSYRGDIAVEELLEKYSDENSYFLKVDGINVHVKVKGQGEPIFLIHGSFSSLHTWETWENELSPFFMTISMDLPGHGLTGPDPDKRYAVTDYARLVFGIADQLGIDEFHVAGNSMGGGVALVMASSNPDRILSLNLIDSSGAPAPENTNKVPSSSQRGGGAWIFKVAENPVFSRLLLKCTPEFLFKINLKQVFGDDSKITSEMVKRYHDLMRREGNRQATVDRLTVRRPYEVDFSKLNMPVLIIWGAKDTWIPLAAGKRLKAAIPEATLKVFENAGHVPMEEIPTETVAEYLSFLGIQSDRDYFNSPKFYTYVP